MVMGLAEQSRFVSENAQGESGLDRSSGCQPIQYGEVNEQHRLDL